MFKIPAFIMMEAAQMIFINLRIILSDIIHHIELPLRRHLGALLQHNQNGFRHIVGIKEYFFASFIMKSVYTCYQQLLLIPEILVNGSFRNTQMPRKVVHRDAFDSRPPEQFRGFFDDTLFDHVFKKNGGKGI
jgi:hypothetical protein